MWSIASKNGSAMKMTINSDQRRIADITEFGLRDGDITEDKIKQYLSAGILSPEEVCHAIRVLRYCNF